MKHSDPSTQETRPIQFVPWVSLWLAGGAFAFVLLLKDFLQPSLDNRIGRDFTNLWTAGKLVLDGRGDWAFDTETFRLALVEYLGMPTSIQLYSYPPHALFVGVPFALLPYYVALALWSILGVAFFAWAARPYLPKGFPPLLAALTPAGCTNLWDGHYGLMLGALWLLFFSWYKNRPVGAGAVAAAMTIKPHLGLAIAFTALSRRKVVLIAAIGTLALVLLSALAFGAGSWRAFLFNTSAVHSELLRMSSDAFYFRMIPSAYVTWGRGALGVAAQVAVIAATAALFWRYRRWDVFIAATATILVIPYSLNYDMAVLCLGAIILMWRYWAELTLQQKIMLGAGFLSPNLTFLWPIAWTTPIVLLMLLNLQLRLAEREARAS